MPHPEPELEHIPAPGSDEAVKLGCRCPILDNNHGKGAFDGPDGKPMFWYTDDCPLLKLVSKESNSNANDN